MHTLLHIAFELQLLKLITCEAGTWRREDTWVREGILPQAFIGNAILATIGQNIIDAAGPLQLCVGQQAGCEAAVHAMSSLYDSQTTEAILLVDGKQCI